MNKLGAFLKKIDVFGSLIQFNYKKQTTLKTQFGGLLTGVCFFLGVFLVYFFGKEGKSTVVKAGKQFEKLAENLLDGAVVATPAILDRNIFLRTDDHLYRIGKE